MTRLPRRARPFGAVFRFSPLGLGVASAAGAVNALLGQDWLIALWAGLAAGLAFLCAVHSCPAPAPAARGVQIVHFVGGAQDGGQGVVATDGRNLVQEVISIDGTDYRVTGVRTTCYTAEADA